MLLTSGQVSVAISSFIVFIFTTALFLSGYVLQQQTVRDLRAAIRPHDVPTNARLYLPTQFIVPPTPSPKAYGVSDEIKAPGDNFVVLEVKESNSDGQDDALVLGGRKGSKIQKSRLPSQDYSVILTEGERQKPLELQNQESATQVGIPEKVISSLPEVEKAKEKSTDEKQIGRAERRRKIKQEILDIGEGDGFKGYRRRMW